MAGRSVSAGKTPLDRAMAALAAASVGFVMFAMPDAIFSGLVATSGLPALIPAAEPPLGQTARLAAVVLAALGTFFLVSLILRALGQQAPRPKTAPTAVAPEPEPEPQLSSRRRSFIAVEEPAPKIRRADAHPDAPARRPLFAGSDLGEPLDEIELSYGDEEWSDDYSEDRAREPLPDFMTGDPAPLAGDDYDEEAPVEVEHLAPPEIMDAAGPVAAFEPPAFEPEPYEPVEFAPAPYPPEPPTMPEAPATADEEDYRPVIVQQQPPAPACDDAPAEHGEATISDLMQRLERGLQRRGEQEWGSAVEAPAPHLDDVGPANGTGGPERSAQKPVDDRLRSALDDLQKMASRGSQA